MNTLIITSERILDKREEKYLNLMGIKNLILSTIKGNTFNVRDNKNINIEVSNMKIIYNKDNVMIQCWKEVESAIHTEVLVGCWQLKDTKIEIVDNN